MGMGQVGRCVKWEWGRGTHLQLRGGEIETARQRCSIGIASLAAVAAAEAAPRQAGPLWLPRLPKRSASGLLFPGFIVFVYQGRCEQDAHFHASSRVFVVMHARDVAAHCSRNSTLA